MCPVWIPRLWAFGSQSQRCITPCTSNHGVSPNDSANDMTLTVVTHPQFCACACIQPRASVASTQYVRRCRVVRVRGCEGARVRGCEGARVRGCEGARVRGCEGARVRGCEVCKGARVRGCEGVTNANMRATVCIAEKTWRQFQLKTEEALCMCGFDGRDAFINHDM
jgi:hypothetical protein